MPQCIKDDLTSIRSEGQDPIALMRWSTVRIFFKACYAFIDAGRRHKKNSSNCLSFLFFEVNHFIHNECSNSSRQVQNVSDKAIRFEVNLFLCS